MAVGADSTMAGVASTMGEAATMGAAASTAAAIGDSVRLYATVAGTGPAWFVGLDWLKTWLFARLNLRSPAQDPAHRWFLTVQS